MSISLEQLAKHIGAELDSASMRLGNTEITGINSPESASGSEITFIASESYLPALASTKAAAVILHGDFAKQSPVPTLIHHNAYLAYAQISALFAPSVSEPGIHPSAVVSDRAEVHASAYVGPQSTIESDAIVGAGVVVGPGVFIGKGAKIGDNTRLHANACIYHEVELGKHCIVHSGTVIGSDGFGFAPTENGWVKIHQLGRVIVGDDVEIGANCAIDRGALGATKIANGVKIDNLVHIAHNVEIGENSAVAGQVGIAGSSKIGKQCMFAGQVGITGHVEIADSVTLTGQAMVTKSIKEAGVYSSGTSFSPAAIWRRNVARFQQLDSLFKRLRKVEQKIGIK